MLGRRVDDVVEEVVTLTGGFVVLVDELSAGPETTVDVVLAWVESGPSEQPPRPAASAKAMSARARTLLRNGQEARFIG